MPNIRIQDKSVQVPAGTTAREALAEYVKDHAGVIAARLEGRGEIDLARTIDADGRLVPITFDDPAGRDIFMHSAAHVMAQAIKELHPQAKLTIGPAVEDGFYYDIDRETPFTEEELPKIEERMREVVKRNLPITREDIPREDAKKMFASLGETYKVELLDGIPDANVSVYRQGDFVDLCLGPHVPSTGEIRAFKLTSLAGAYWRGDEKNRQLSRIYGVAFPDQKKLDEYLELLKEAERRDHRRLGKDLDLFSFHEEGGPGLVYWHPKGAIVRRVIEDFWRSEHEKHGYDLVFSPHIGKAKLWETSGHLDFYQDSMYSPIEIDGQKYYLKPMNCPFHILMYRVKMHSYRELPIRYCELGTVYRYERSGTLHGLLRVRGFTQDDAHIFVTPDEMTKEVCSVIEFVMFMLRSFGFSDFSVFLSTRPEKYVGTDDMWELATSSLRDALEKEKLPYDVDEGGGVFYGPKIDIKIRDCLGRLWQCSTIQVDFNLTERFDVKYVAEDGSQKRVVMIHRALLGAMERFFAVLLEHCAGDFPVWLAPVQATILTITSDQELFAREVVDRLKAEGVRVNADLGSDKIGNKIRKAELAKVPFMLVIGKRESAAGKVAVRRKGKGDEGAVTVDEFVVRIKEEKKPPAS